MKHYLMHRMPTLAAVTVVTSGAVCAFWPIQARLHRGAMIVALLVAWLWCIMAVWRRWRIAASVIAAVGVCVGLFLCAPGREFDKERLRTRYTAALQRYEGTRYVWGGETRLGIDCSGLVREGLVNACVAEGIATVNPPGLQTQLTNLLSKPIIN